MFSNLFFLLYAYKIETACLYYQTQHIYRYHQQRMIMLKKIITQPNMLLACNFAVYKTKAQPKFILASQTSTKLMAGISIYSVKNKEFSGISS
ncbi:hypothetical protein M441DRAFT_449990 [Trichoderma asperellum CBS 433.97]|uniref:Uncharacterized protein n=1 Tax=Trichoderma asperellum (strain ATCC 204424 / CBS 433.97 / NBRC 101777) TaxID=1042311 RepID=A0A2T3YTS3_TRIA4|nr:hypothetical protein M441DRAFT_449990 [Trichoderma asperellum CBS 433.97]PTB35973.1 hypothetical protein M441DRAFT_449990 [Trichoderma asperellum CBS 433.97]